MNKKNIKVAPKTRNLVAKHAREFNKAVVMRDRTKYSRKDKHKNTETV